MLRNLLNKKNEDEGFTLIELLVVILIIGILAAIALPTFLGQSNKSKDASAKSNARNAVSQMESCLVDQVAGTCATTADVTQFKNTTVTAQSDTLYTVTATTAASSGGAYTIQKLATGFKYGVTGTPSGAAAWAANGVS